MKKLKILALVLSVAALGCSMIACGDKDDGHTHTFDTAHWAKSDTHHWHEATCGHDVAPEDCDGYAAHTTSGTCVCGKTQSDAHTEHKWSTTYTIDGDEHYQTCDGCDEKKYDGHEYGTSGVCVCGKEEPETVVAATGVKLDKSEIELVLGGAGEKLTATVMPENATDKSVTYSATPNGIVSIDNAGNVTALDKGTAVITVKTANNKTATCNVTVNAPQQSEKIESVQDLIANYGTEVKEALEDNYLYNMGRQCIGRTFKTEKVLGSEWHVNIGENISKIDVVMRYDEGNGYSSYILGTIELNSPINVKELTKDTITGVLAEDSSNATYTLSYTFMYNDKMATERAELKNAICDKVFGENEGAIRYIKDNGYSGTDSLGEVRQFTVVQISANEVKEISVNIKYSSNDIEYISKLSSTSNYRTYSEKSYTISGEKVENNNSAFGD